MSDRPLYERIKSGEIKVNRKSPAEHRFWAKVEKSKSCWIWTAGTIDGYGQFSFPAGQRAHRYSWELHNGPVPERLCVLHRCDNPPCVNPDHLFLGTREENLEDMTAKGRRARGSVNGNSKLTEKKVVKIKKLLSLGVKYKDIAEQFGVAEITIYRISSKLSWEHVKSL